MRDPHGRIIGEIEVQLVRGVPRAPEHAERGPGAARDDDRSSEWLAERGVLVDQSTIYRWVQRFLPLFGEVARKYRKLVGPDWRGGETYPRIPGPWAFNYPRIVGPGNIVDSFVQPTDEPRPRAQ